MNIELDARRYAAERSKREPSTPIAVWVTDDPETYYVRSELEGDPGGVRLAIYCNGEEVQS